MPLYYHKRAAEYTPAQALVALIESIAARGQRPMSQDEIQAEAALARRALKEET